MMTHRISVGPMANAPAMAGSATLTAESSETMSMPSAARRTGTRRVYWCERTYRHERSRREGTPMDIAVAQQFLREKKNAVLATWRRDGRLQMSPVIVGLDGAGRAILSSRESAYKVRNLRRDPRAMLCVFGERFVGPWMQIEGTAEVVTLPEAMEPLVDYYRRLAGEHPDWDDYRRAMTADRRVLIRMTIERAGPDRQG